MSEIILEIGAQGGSITLAGSRDNKWLFSLHVHDCSDDEEPPEDNQDISSISKSSLASLWPEALDLLHHYTWHPLYPLTLHPEFERFILYQVRYRGGDAEVECWRQTLKKIGHFNYYPELSRHGFLGLTSIFTHWLIPLHFKTE